MDIKITVGNKQVETTMLSVREYLSIINDADEMIPKIIFNKIGQPLPKHLTEQALIKLIAISKKKVIKMKSECTLCHKENKFEVHPDTVCVSDGLGLSHVAGGMVINMRYPMMFEDRDMFEMIDRCIVSFEYADQLFKWENSTENEKDILFKHLTFSDIEAIVEKLQSPQVYAAVPIECECGNQYPAVINGASKLLDSLGVK